jgi:hypothetical protein
MKTRTLFNLALILTAALALTFVSCKKDNLDTGTADPATLKQLSADENDVQDAMNDAEGDITSVMSNNGGNFKSTEWLPCHATVDSLSKENDTITIYITYNGLTCNGKLNKTGKIEIRKKAGSHWELAGAKVIYKFIDLTVTRISTGKSITLNGTKTFENVSGGHRWMVGTTLTSYVEKASGTMQATFDNGTVRTWNVARQLTYTGTPGNYLLTIDGFGTSGDYQNLVVWGTNRVGEQFYTQITQPVICRQACKWDPVSGIKVHQIPADNKSATTTFGFDENNEPITGDNCPARYRLDWQRNNKSGTSFLPL